MNKDKLIHIVNTQDTFEQHLTINLDTIKEYYFYNSKSTSAQHKLIIQYNDGTDRIFGGNMAQLVFEKLVSLFDPAPIQVNQNIPTLNN